jgi:hypothetical protein
MGDTPILLPATDKPLDKYAHIVELAGQLVKGAQPVVIAALGLLYFLSDIYHFFWVLVAFAGLETLFLLCLIFNNRRASTLAPDVMVKRVSNATLYVLVCLSSCLIIGVLLMLGFYHHTIFDPVRVNQNDSALSYHSKTGEEEWETVSRLVTQGENGNSADLPTPYGIMIIKDRESSKPYTLSFDVIKKSRYSWIKIDNVSLIVSSVKPLPSNVKPVQENRRVTAIKRGIDLKVTVPPGSRPPPTAHPALIVGAVLPVTQRGSIVIEDSSPQTFFVDVSFSTPGVYEVVPEIVVNDGWSKNRVTVGDPIPVYCFKQTVLEAVPPPRLPPPPKTAPKPPEKVKKPPLEKDE